MFSHPVPYLIRRTDTQESPTYQAAKSPYRRLKIRLWLQMPRPLEGLLLFRGSGQTGIAECSAILP